MRDKTDTMPTGALLGLLDSCLAQGGRDDWAAPFTGLVEATGAAQVMIFSYAEDRADCLLSRNFREARTGARLAQNYLEGWYLDDPLYPAVCAAAPGTLRLVTDDAYAPEMTGEYRWRFFTEPKLASKTAILAVGQRLRLIVNLYWAEGADPAEAALLPLLGRLALLHFEARPEYSLPAPLAVLSERERAVCLGILSGRKAEQIAADLDVAPSSVVTYRARAYAKLGISSRGSLFALCGGGVGIG